MLDYSSLFNSMITGLFVGIGSAFGTWFVTHHFIRHLEQFEKELSLKETEK
jgi:site-specific recombinase